MIYVSMMKLDKKGKTIYEVQYLSGQPACRWEKAYFMGQVGATHPQPMSKSINCTLTNYEKMNKLLAYFIFLPFYLQNRCFSS